MQQTGIPFIITQHTHPGIIIAVMQSQQAWAVLAQFASPLVQVIMTPMSIISTLQVQHDRLQQQVIIPFIVMQHEHIPPAVMLQRFCIIMAAVLSWAVQVIRIPPSIFSILTVQRGIIIPGIPAMPPIWGIMPEGMFIIPMFMPMPGIIPMPIMPMPPVMPRSVVVVPVIGNLLIWRTS